MAKGIQNFFSGSRQTGLIIVLVVFVAVLVVLGVASGVWKSYRTKQMSAMSRAGESYTIWRQAPEADRQEQEKTLLDELAPLQRSRVPYVHEKALLLFGLVDYYNKEYAKAESTFSNLAMISKTHLKGSSILNYGAVLDKLNKRAEAIVAYQALTESKKEKGKFNYFNALFQIGRLQELSNDKTDAVTTYKRIVAEAEGSNLWRVMAENRLIVLGA